MDRWSQDFLKSFLIVTAIVRAERGRENFSILNITVRGHRYNIMKKGQGKIKLTGKQVRYLRGLGHHLKPLVMLGREGLDKNVITAVDEVLRAHELVKIKIGNGCLIGRQEAADMVAERIGAAVVQILGKTALLFRANPDRKDDKRINLPD